jgi:hypothetical protein
VLYKFAVGGGAPIPPLPTVPIPDSAAEVGEFLIMAGRGMRLNAGTVSEDQTAPYSWGAPGTSDAVPFRWGRNTVEQIGLTDAAGAFSFSTDFDEPTTPYDGQASVGDSGGSGFILRDGQWWLAGLMNTVDDGPDAETKTNPAGYGDITYFVDLQTYRPEIVAVTGSLVPEPGAGGLLAGAVFILLKRRRATRD